MSSLTALRKKGRESLHGNWTTAALITLLLFFLQNIFSLTDPLRYISKEHAAALVNSASYSSFRWLAFACWILITGAFILGAARFYLHLVRKENASVSTVFSFFREGNLFLNSIVFYVLRLIYLVLWFLLLIIPGIIKSYSYALSSYILIDEPNLTPNEAITKSRQLMHGKKWRLFLLTLSFFGWFLLGIVTLGIGFLWVAPYYQTTVAEFYQEVKESQNLIEEEALEV